MTASPTVQPRSLPAAAPAATGYHRHRWGPVTDWAIASGPRTRRLPPPNVRASPAAHFRKALAAPLSRASFANARSAAMKCEAGPLGRRGVRFTGRPANRPGVDGGSIPIRTRAETLHLVLSRLQTAMYRPRRGATAARRDVLAAIPQVTPRVESRASLRPSGCQLRRR